MNTGLVACYEITCINSNKQFELMKHGLRYWQTKLNKKPSHRASLVSNLLGQLIQHEQIHTTLAKAKVLQHEMEKVCLYAVPLIYLYSL